MFDLVIRNTENDAFAPDMEAQHTEVARILREVATRVLVNGAREGAIADVNGTRVGSFHFD